MFKYFIVKTFIVCALLCLSKALGYSEIYGDILYPSSWDLTLYEGINYSENKCYEEKP